MISFRKRQGYPCVNAQQNNKHGLHGVYNEYKIEGVCIRYAIKYQHRLHGKMPRTSPIGSRNHNGNTTHYKRNESTHHTQMRRSVKTEKREIVMQEVTYSYSQCENKEQRHVAQRQHALPNTCKGGFHLIINM